MTYVAKDLLVRINKEMDAYAEQEGEGMTHEEGFDFAKRLIGPLYESSIELVRLRAELEDTRDALEYSESKRQFEMRHIVEETKIALGYCGLEAELAATWDVIDATREVLEFLPDDDAAPQGRSAHVDTASKLRKALATLDAKIGELK